MKTKTLVSHVLPPVLLLGILLTGCGCKHEWQAANCETPKTCTRCQITEGEALGHTWADATTEAPKTCTVCQKTEGEKISIDPRFTIAACQELFGTWKGVYKMPSTIIDANLTLTLDLEVSFIFNDDGTCQNIAKITNKDDFAQITEYDLSSFEYESTGVYYIADGKIFIGAKWDDTLRPETYSIADNVLTIDMISQAYPGLVLTKS